MPVPGLSAVGHWIISSAFATCTVEATRSAVRSNSANWPSTSSGIAPGDCRQTPISRWKFGEQFIEATISLTTLLVQSPFHIKIQHPSCRAHGYRPRHCEAPCGCLRSNASAVLPAAPCNPSLPDLHLPRSRRNLDSQLHRSERNTRQSSRPRAAIALA